MNIPTSARPVPFRLLDRRDRAPARPLLTVLAAAVNVRLKIALSVAVLAAVWPALGPGGVAAAGPAGQAAVTLGQIDAFSREGLFRGLSNPRAVSTAGGRLFVADADNNRVLIWNSIPTTNHTPPDIVVGQRNLSENEPNQGGRGAGTLNAPQGAFSDGTRLFVADSNNSRVLIWNSIPTANQAAADVVLGQRDFTSAGRGLFASMNYPMAVFSDGTRLFVTDSYNNRVLIWNNIPTANQAPADVVLGQPDLLSAAGGLSAATLNFPSAVFSDGTRLFVTDQVNHRVLIWNSIPTSNQAAANTVLGQPNFTAATQNNGGRGAGTLSYPNGVFSDGRKLFVSDGGNNRVLIWNSIPTSNQATANVVLGPPNFASDASTTNTGEQDASTLPGPTGVFSDGTRLFISSQLGARVLIWNSIPTSNRTSANVVLGQPGFTTRTSNNGGLDAGTLRYPTGGFASGARLFVADTGNNRVLIWNSIPASNQTSANVVLGQPNFTRATVVSPLAGTLNQPHGVFSDGTRLFVADTRNNRVLIWNSIPTSNQTAADVVLGQPNFNWRIENYPGLSAASLFEPIGVFSDGRRLFVADKFNNRVLIWNKIPTSNQAGANVVLGQPDFTSATENNGGLGAATLKEPAGVFSDGRRLCVADSGNHRVLIWNSIPTSNQTSADAVRGQPDFTSGLPNNGGRGPGTLSTPSGVFSDETRLFVADAENDRVIFVSDTTAPTVALTYSKDRAAVGAGELTITATFSKAIATTPTLAIQGPGDVNDQAAAGMTPTATSTVWVFTRAIATGGDGDATVTIANGQDASGNWNRPATNASFAIDATAPTFELTYSKDKAAVGAGELTITATFSEAIVTTPTLAIDGSGVANDQAVTDMTATATSTVWTFTKRIVTGGNGNATVTIANGRDAAGNENLPPTNAVFVIDAIVPAGLQILRTGAPDRVSTGQTFPVSVTLTNSGEATANVTGVRLSFRSSGGVERSSQYSLLASPALPFPLAGGETRTVTFSVKASDTASTGLLTVDASASGRDLHSDAVLFDSGGDATASLNVQRRAQLDIAMFTLPSSVVQGQRFTATLLVRNSGEASAGLSAVALAFRVAANNVGSSGFLVLSPTGISGLVSGSETVTLSLSVAVAGDVAPGTYTGHATVHGADQNSGAEAGDGNGADSPTSLQVIRFNHPPSATASSPEPLIRRGNSFVLVGSATDPDGDRPLTYTWSFLTRPAGSVLSDASFQPNGTAAAFRTSFVPDKRGTYLVRLVVSDSLANSEPVTVALTLANTRPSVSVAASPLVTLAGRFVTLSALGEDRDPEDTLTYGWRFDAVPADSARTNSDISPNGTVAAAVTGFTPDVPGTFRLSVAASDGADASIRATAEVRVSPAGTPLVFIAPVDGTTLTADLSGATGFQTRVAIETTATPGTAIELRVNGGAPISVNRPAGSDSVVFENVTLIDGRQNVLEVRFTDSSLTVRSATVSVLVRENRPPLAAIASQVTTGGPRAVELDGSGSTAESGLTLTYAWTLSRAPARAASFSSSLVTTRVA
ncbi:MAG: hypothetical protein HY303_10755, partial [Candidatus Wallbacteria bacterium]|nr:hypothetical protein [Candidatus Wallbacteria bacterium]